LTNVELIHVYFILLCCNACNPLSYLSSIEPLSGGNYGTWREKIEIGLALWDLDLALMSDPPIELAEPVIRDGENDDTFVTKKRVHAEIRIKYNLEHAKWDSFNRKCLMVIKSFIVEAIRGAIP
jgi:hypothetical protein